MHWYGFCTVGLSANQYVCVLIFKKRFPSKIPQTFSIWSCIQDLKCWSQFTTGWFIFHWWRKRDFSYFIASEKDFIASEKDFISPEEDFVAPVEGFCCPGNRFHCPHERDLVCVIIMIFVVARDSSNSGVSYKDISQQSFWNLKTIQMG